MMTILPPVRVLLAGFSRKTALLFIVLTFLYPRCDAVATGFEVLRLGGKLPGAKLLIVAGIHGNERSAPDAIRLFMAGQPPNQGTIVAVPEACPEALAVGERRAPGWSDLNRAFPDSVGRGYTRRAATNHPPLVAFDPAIVRAQALMDFIAAERPGLVLDLHESNILWTEGYGPSLVMPRNAAGAETVLRLLELPELAGFSFTGPPPRGSLAAAVNDILGIRSLIVEVPGSLCREARLAAYLRVIKAAWIIMSADGSVNTHPLPIP